MVCQRKVILGWIGLFVSAAACTSAAGEPKLLPQQLLNEGWISLFDGETMFGWQPSGNAKWEIVDGEIRTDGAKPGWLMTTTEWADFAIHFEFRAPAKSNSGVFMRSALNPKDPTEDCIELNIAPPDNPFPTASFVGRKKIPVMTHPESITEGKHRFTLEDPKEVDLWDDRWHTIEVGVVGHEAIRLCVDGEYLFETIDLNGEKASGAETPRLGFIGLQSKEGSAAFRNLRIWPQAWSQLFNRRDLEGWSTDRAEKCKFDVTQQGELHMSNGPGQIDTVADFTNFVLHIDCMANGDGLNSGVFFRTLREGWCAGYESQIQNGFKDGDRTKPKDSGTGAIYRRQAARYVVPNDHEWFTKTIVADGPHMAVWVNGYQVSDWTDTRPPKENAREGRRDAGGAIALQGHDATTDFLFRNIRAVELPR